MAPVGSSVLASGWYRVGPAGDTVFDANSITNSPSRATVTLAEGVLPPAPPQAEPVAVITGTVRIFNYAPDGQVNGLILSDGTALYFPPEYATQVTSAVSVSGRVRVAGWTRIGPTESERDCTRSIAVSGNQDSTLVNRR